MFHAGDTSLDPYRQHLPRGYNLFKCASNKGDFCGCYTALKKKHASERPKCKIHGVKADVGAEPALRALKRAGYEGPVVTQFPVFSLCGKHVSRALPSMNKSTKGVCKAKGGVFSSRCLKLDMLLVSPVCSSVFAVIEVQGKNHSDARVLHRDCMKYNAIIGKFAVFELSGCDVQYTSRGSRSRQCASACESDMLPHLDSKAAEAVEYLRKAM